MFIFHCSSLHCVQLVITDAQKTFVRSTFVVVLATEGVEGVEDALRIVSEYKEFTQAMVIYAQTYKDSFIGSPAPLAGKVCVCVCVCDSDSSCECSLARAHTHTHTNTHTGRMGCIM